MGAVTSMVHLSPHLSPSGLSSVENSKSKSVSTSSTSRSLPKGGQLLAQSVENGSTRNASERTENRSISGPASALIPPEPPDIGSNVSNHIQTQTSTFDSSVPLPSPKTINSENSLSKTPTNSENFANVQNQNVSTISSNDEESFHDDETKQSTIVPPPTIPSPPPGENGGHIATPPAFIPGLVPPPFLPGMHTHNSRVFDTRENK